MFQVQGLSEKWLQNKDEIRSVLTNKDNQKLFTVKFTRIKSHTCILTTLLLLNELFKTLKIFSIYFKGYGYLPNTR